jgi:DNA polymerase-3 subunit alpha
MYLNCHTYFSFKYGTLSIEGLFAEARRCGVRKLALTDINNTSGYIEMLRICNENRSEYDLEITLGIEFWNKDQLLYIGLAENNEGFQEINGYLSYHNTTGAPLRKKAPEFSHVFIIYPFEGGKGLNQDYPEPSFLRENEFIGIRPRDINRIRTCGLESYMHKLVILQSVTIKDKLGFNIHRLLRAVDQNTILSKLDPSTQASPDEFMMPEHVLADKYSQFPQIVENTRWLMLQCSIDFELGTDKNKATFTGQKRSDREKLMSLAMEGFDTRYNRHDHRARSRLFKELDIISSRNFESYFLVAHDIIQFAEHKGFSHVGRGSGANSVAAYCLQITDVDPIDLDLYFERFLNPERTSPPDFDIDFSWKDRDEVTQYIFDKHTTRHTALLGTHSTFKDRSLIRELGKVFGLPKSEIDTIVSYPEQSRNRDHITQLIFRYAEKMYSIPSHLSIHAGGVLITEKPIYAYTATDLPPKGFPVVHFEMHNAEDIGIYKLDILSQRGLGHIKDTAALVKKNRGTPVDINRFDEFKKDSKIKNLLSRGKTMGCFYVESPAMRMLLGKLGCDNYTTLVAASSIIRPGVARSGMMREYIYRHHNPDGYTSIHPQMDDLMKETYGVMVYQEDVIKVAHKFAGLTLSEADILRRGMSGKYRSRKEFQRVHDQFFENCRKRGYPQEVTDRVWFEIESFSGYSFAKGHSASYAVESYQSLFLKAHYPLEFMVGVINNFGGFYRTEFYFHEARMDGASIEAPCINHSEYTTTIIGDNIYMGFIHLKSLETKIGERIPVEREHNGPFTSMDNFVRRIPSSLEQLCILIRIGALRFSGKTKRELLWEAHLYFGKGRHVQYSHDLFDLELPDYKLPKLEREPFEDAFDEMELLGFPLCDPFSLLATGERGNSRANQLQERTGKIVSIAGYLVTTKNTRTKGGKLMHFGTFLDKHGEVFDTTHFPPVAKRYPFRGKGFYMIFGKVVEDFGYPMIEVTKMDKLPLVSKEEPQVRLKPGRQEKVKT